MTNEEAIESLKFQMFLAKKDTEYCPNERGIEALDMAIQALEQQRWISCNKQQPTEEGEYLVTTYSGGMYDVETSWFWIYEDGDAEWGDYGVIAWKPLPEPYKDGEE